MLLGDRRRSSSLIRQIHNLDEQDAEEAYEEQDEADNRGLGALHHIRSRTRSRPDQIVIGWEPDDPENPYNWTDASLPLLSFFLVPDDKRPASTNTTPYSAGK